MTTDTSRRGWVLLATVLQCWCFDFVVLWIAGAISGPLARFSFLGQDVGPQLVKDKDAFVVLAIGCIGSWIYARIFLAKVGVYEWRPGVVSVRGAAMAVIAILPIAPMMLTLIGYIRGL